MFVEVEHRRELREHPGVVRHHVHVAVAIPRGFGELLDCRPVGHVARDPDGIDTDRGQLGDHVGGAGRIDVGDHDVAPGTRQRQCDAPTDPAAAPGDDRHRALESLHPATLPAHVA